MSWNRAHEQSSAKKIPTFKIKKAKAEWLYFFGFFLEGKKPRLGDCHLR
jgi:hypothetical protein